MAMEQLYHMLHRYCDLTFYIIKDEGSRYFDQFPSSRYSRVITERFRGVMFFFGLLFRGWRYDYIHISTGPEESHYVAIPRIIGFYLCSKLYGKKIILMVRNILPYISNSKLAYSTSRYRSIESIKMFSFESDTLRREFVRNVITPGARYCVTYGKYSNVANNNVGDFGGSGSNMRVGLLGSVDCDRRDYDTIINALSLLSVDHVRLIEFVVLGRCPGGKNNEIIKRLSEVTNVDVINENLTEDELTKGGLSCDILIAPLIKERLYGRLKGTGAFRMQFICIDG